MGATDMRRRTITSMLLLCAMSATGQQRGGNGKAMQQRAKQYSECRSARERLLFCVAAIDDAIIDLQVNVDDLKVIFGEDFTDLGPVGIDGAKYAAMVSFERLPGVAEPVASNTRVPAQTLGGWYLQIEYDKYRRVRNYWLADVHKGMPKRQQHSRP